MTRCIVEREHYFPVDLRLDSAVPSKGTRQLPSMTYALITVPAPGAYAFALSQPFVKEHHRRLLVAHAAMPDLLAGVGQLGASAGVSGHSYVNLHYGVLGHRVSDFLGLDPPLCDRGPLWTAALAEGTRLGAGRRWYWRLYPQVREALDELGWLGR